MHGDVGPKGGGYPSFVINPYCSFLPRFFKDSQKVCTYFEVYLPSIMELFEDFFSPYFSRHDQNLVIFL